ncbi:hypothetical protein BDQ17DRAFT_1343794 [Cyathus striatus]|nr:hypothetical protein BDQ17DRAFT_1343794 [Cyathus striatus]
MPFSYRDLFFGGTTFCCCLPVRMGVISMSILGILVAGVLSLILWFEVATTPDMSSGEKAAFVIAGLVETFLFAASIFGFVGAVVRKQTFVQVYAYIIYVHFVLNLGVAAFLLYEVTRFSSNAAVAACQKTIKNEQAQEQCSGFLSIATGVYWAISVLVLLIELYGAIIVTRYVNQLMREKRRARSARMEINSAFAVSSGKNGKYHTHQETPSESYEPLMMEPLGRYDHDTEEFDPYREVELSVPTSNPVAGHSHEYDGVPPLIPIEIGYGGGTWTHSEISTEEKERLKRKEQEQEIIGLSSPPLNEELSRRKSVFKSFSGSATVLTKEGEDLPQYSQ